MSTNFKNLLSAQTAYIETLKVARNKLDFELDREARRFEAYQTVADIDGETFGASDVEAKVAAARAKRDLAAEIALQESSSKAPTAPEAKKRGEDTLAGKMIRVMGTKSMRTKDIAEALEAHGWTPNSKNVTSYLSTTLSTNKEVFERVEQGLYRVSPAYLPAGKAAPKAKAAAAPKVPTQVVGKAPPLHQRIASVLGDKVMSPKEVLEALTAIGQAPTGPSAPVTVSSTLSTRTELFTRVSRGAYRLATSKASATPAASKARKATATPQAAPKTPTTPRELVASGALLPLRQRIALIMGDQEMKASQVVEALRARDGWLPNSKDPNNYITMTLSTQPEFVHVRHGFYRYDASLAKAPRPRKIQARSTNGIQNALATTSGLSPEQTESELANLHGGDVARNPFVEG